MRIIFILNLANNEVEWLQVDFIESILKIDLLSTTGG